MINILDFNNYIKLIRDVSSEGCVLLENKFNTLPIKESEKIAIFGRTQFETYISGTGSGGMVNYPYVVNIFDGLSSQREVDCELADIYKQFINENKFDKGEGWAQEPWCQKELELTKEIVENASKKTDIALFVVGRSAGEDKDCQPVEGSYYLTQTEKANLKLITETFDKTVVLLNVGNIMDMSFVNEFNPSAVLYAWHGGCESGNAYADVLTGKVNPSGSLPDTIAYAYNDNLANNNFGNKDKNLYQEDIYVGYRYFETFAKEKVQYPFGFGLSYTNFEIEDCHLLEVDNKYEVLATIKNVGSFAGKKSVQCYLSAPCGNLGKSEKSLVGFEKTVLLQPHQSCEVKIQFDKKYISSYDEVGKTGHKSCFVIEEGEYKFFLGFDVRTAKHLSSLNFDKTIVVEKCSQQLAPTIEFDRLVAVLEDDKTLPKYEKVPCGKADMYKRMIEKRKEVCPQTFNGYTFSDILSGEITPYELAQELSDLDLIHMTRGEGMCSPKVTSGTAGCYGGVTKTLSEKKIPILCCADGPSGIRMDSGTMAMSMPNGANMASTFDKKLIFELFEQFALELVSNNIDSILGPGMNIHRSPLCGRNFEYFSEDPVLTGQIAVAQLTALHKYGVSGTAKHLACNNQENDRRIVDSVVSERALREIYLRGFEIAVKEGGLRNIMTSYNSINGVQSSSNFDLCTNILRGEWGYDGVVMTDWWGDLNLQGEKATTSDTRAMILAQNDVFMVNADAEANSNKDNSEEKLANGELNRFELLRTGENIIRTLLKHNCSTNYASHNTLTVQNIPQSKFPDKIYMGVVMIGDEISLPLSKEKYTRGMTLSYDLRFEKLGKYEIIFDVESKSMPLAQLPLTIKASGANVGTISLNGTMRKRERFEQDIYINISTYLDLFFAETGIEINSIIIRKI